MDRKYETVFINNLSDDQALALMDILTASANKEGISTQEYVRRWLCGDRLQS